MIPEAIVLAGGLGTRLKPVVSDLPKSLAPVAGRPFLAYLLDHSLKQGLSKFIFALGFRSEQIMDFVKTYLPAGTYSFSTEEEPLGTGGAVFQACALTTSENLIVLNADTFFGVSLEALSDLQMKRNPSCTLALKPMRNFDRYGVVETGENQVITGFREKKFRESGLINGGVYALHAASFRQKKFPRVFSLEKDFFEKEFPGEEKLGLISDAYFIDIGVPEDYERAQTELIRNI